MYKGYSDRFKEYKFCGVLAELMRRYVAEKRATGRLFNKQSQMLARLDRLSIKIGLDKPELTKKLVEIWITRSPNESRKNQRYRLNFIKLFGEFMVRLGYSAYIPNLKISSQDDDVFAPYIFTREELSRIFVVIDNLPKSYSNPNRVFVYPMLFRILYCCGLRVSEALNLKVEDVDLQGGVLKIWLAKHGKHRSVPMSTEIIELCKIYADKIHSRSVNSDYFFPNARGEAYHPTSISKHFRKWMQSAGIPYYGKGYGPRLHDLRHTFSVHCLQKWDRAGVDLNAALPYLSSYLGHNKLSGTQKYLHLTTDAYRDLNEKLERYSNGIIPKLEMGCVN